MPDLQEIPQLWPRTANKVRKLLKTQGITAAKKSEKSLDIPHPIF